MYQKRTCAWLKHFDFIFLDFICLQLAFFLSCLISRGIINPYADDLYLKMALFMGFANIFIALLFETYQGFFKRGFYLEFAASIKQGVMLMLAGSLFLVILKEGELYSRSSFFLMIVVYVVITYVSRLIWKRIFRHIMKHVESASLVIVTTKERAAHSIRRLRKNNFKCYKLSGVIIVDRNEIGTTIEGVEVIANIEDAADTLLQMWVDEVYIDVGEDEYPLQLIEQCSKMGLTLHFNLSKRPTNYCGKQYVETMGDITVLTRSLNFMTTSDVILKRTIDILGGLAGCIATILLTLIIGPIIYLKSPGPIFFSQERVGKNGKLFKMYKFRSMYLDAEEKKAELMKHNKMDNDLMFKLDFDPRIIGNKILLDGTKKTGIGQFIRSTSLDEFPQFFNVLLGQMSLVGYRPALPSEYEQYKYHHRVRICAKPGITGMWQANGRSEITDFEEVVRLDKEYIQNWSMGLDFRLMLKTAVSVLTRKGSM